MRPKVHSCLGIAALLVLAGCASGGKEAKDVRDVKDVVRQNPEIVFQAIEDNPERFVEVVNQAVQKARERQLEKENADAKKQEELDLRNPKQPKLEAARRLSGEDSGKITVVEYADFQCPACGMVYGSLKQFKEKHAGEIQFYFKNMPLPFHKLAQPAALYFEALRRSDREKALKYYEYVFEHQRNIADENFLASVVKRLGADPKRIAKAASSPEIKQIVDADVAEFESFKFTGTPVIVINGVALNGAQPLEEMERVAALTLKK